MSIRFRTGAVSLALALGLLSGPAFAQEWHIYASLGGESKYGDEFKHYDYVNPDAPKGGTLNSLTVGTFDSFNPYVVRGTPAAGMGSGIFGGLAYEMLMDRATDEAVSRGLIADAFKYPDDYSSATYRLDPRAKWQDGQPVTVEDVIWSFNVLKTNSPMYSRYFENVKEAVATGEREVEFRFDQKGNRELPKIMGDLVVLPKHWWEGKDASGKQRDVTQPTMEPPMGSGPYKVASFKAGTEIIWERDPNYWGKDIPVNIGRNNFDRRRYTYFLDQNASFQAFTKGGISDINAEASARDWKTKYDFPALKAGDVIQKDFTATAGENFQGYIVNLRRPKFENINVRKALTFAYDFDTPNKVLTFGLNTRVTNYFMDKSLASKGIPEGKELEILNQYKDQLPPELFTQPFVLPSYQQPQDGRKNRQAAVKAFGDAGWHIKGGKMVSDKDNTPFTIEFLTTSDDTASISYYVNNLRKIGVDMTIRILDTAQYKQRIDNFDFDMVAASLGQSKSPGNEQRDFWSRKAAETPGSRNLMGIKSDMIDALTERVIFASDRDDLEAVTRALDRVLLWNYYTIPQLTRDKVFVAYWNKFGMPEKQPDYIGPDFDSWWIDVEKEKALAAKYKGFN